MCGQQWPAYPNGAATRHAATCGIFRWLRYKNREDGSFAGWVVTVCDLFKDFLLDFAGEIVSVDGSRVLVLIVPSLLIVIPRMRRA